MQAATRCLAPFAALSAPANSFFCVDRALASRETYGFGGRPKRMNYGGGRESLAPLRLKSDAERYKFARRLTRPSAARQVDSGCPGNRGRDKRAWDFLFMSASTNGGRGPGGRGEGEEIGNPADYSRGSFVSVSRNWLMGKAKRLSELHENVE